MLPNINVHKLSINNKQHKCNYKLLEFTSKQFCVILINQTCFTTLLSRCYFSNLIASFTIWLVIFVRDLFHVFYELTAIRENYDHEQLKLKQNNHISICPTWNYLATNRSMSARVPLMVIAEAIQEI